MKPLQTTDITLCGKHLVEASAGSGKTYAITTLYVRLLLEMKFDVSEILVVTYTRAATQELVDRLLHRIRQMIATFDGNECDEELQKLADDLAPEERMSARQRLVSSIHRFDEAAILTIHAFCQRVLAEHPVATSMPFSFELLPNVGPELERLGHDYCATELQPYPSAIAFELQQRGVSPKDLMNLARQGRSPKTRIVPKPRRHNLAQLSDAWLKAHKAASESWTRDKEHILSILYGAPSLSRAVYKEKIIASRWVPTLDALFGEPPFSLPKFFHRLATSSLSVKKSFDPPSHEFFEISDALKTANANLIAGLDDEAIFLRRAFLEKTNDYLGRELVAKGQVTYDDLLYATLAALQGGNGESLSQTLRNQYRAALVDEFQDTDPVQYEIISRIYPEPNSAVSWWGIRSKRSTVSEAPTYSPI